MYMCTTFKYRQIIWKHTSVFPCFQGKPFNTSAHIANRITKYPCATSTKHVSVRIWQIKATKSWSWCTDSQWRPSVVCSSWETTWYVTWRWDVCTAWRSLGIWVIYMQNEFLSIVWPFLWNHERNVTLSKVYLLTGITCWLMNVTLLKVYAWSTSSQG